MVIEKLKQWWVLLFVLVVTEKIEWVDGTPQVPCFFIFGDSLADNGNNNNLQTLAKANYHPYGADYSTGTTGRFTNGKTTVDVMAELLGFDHHIPPYASASGATILQGVNYASGSAGIRDETGRHLGQNINLNRQIANHQATITRMINMLGSNETAMYQLNRCIYWVALGSNDYVNNYYSSQNYSTSKSFTLDSYATALITQLSTQLMTLYNSGARKFVVSGLGLIGCVPHSVAQHGATTGSLCAMDMNEATLYFNNKLVSVVEQFNSALPDAKFVYTNGTQLGLGDPSFSGFTNVMTGCCLTREDGQCIENGTYCSNRKQFVFWDAFHPTEASNGFTAKRIYKALSAYDCYPMDVSGLAQLRLSG